MTLLVERPATTHPETPTRAAVVEGVLRGDSYVTVPAGAPRTRGEGTYVTVAGSGSTPVTSRGSYVTLAGASAVADGFVEGRYVTLPTAA